MSTAPTIRAVRHRRDGAVRQEGARAATRPRPPGRSGVPKLSSHSAQTAPGSARVGEQREPRVLVLDALQARGHGDEQEEPSHRVVRTARRHQHAEDARAHGHDDRGRVGGVEVRQVGVVEHREHEPWPSLRRARSARGRPRSSVVRRACACVDHAGTPATGTPMRYAPTGVCRPLTSAGSSRSASGGCDSAANVGSLSTV